MRRYVFCFLLCLLPALAGAQQTSLGFGEEPTDPDAPVEVTAERLTVSETDGTAIFEGDVVVIQNEMRLTAPVVTVFYAEETGEVARMEATGGVTLVSGEEAAESDRADYDVGSGIIVMTGNVLLTQGRSAVASERMEVDLDTNTALMTGRVQTVLFQGDAPASDGE